MKTPSKHPRPYHALPRAYSSIFRERTFISASSLLAGALFVLTPASQVEANNGTWVGGSSASWSDSANWAASVAGAVGTSNNTGTATFDSTAGAGTPITIDAGRNLRSLLFTGGVGSFIIGTTDGNALYLSTSSAGTGIRIATDATSSQVINAPLILAQGAGSYFIANNATSDAVGFTLNGGISAAAGTAGTSILSLAGSSPGVNTIYGSISDGAGTVSVSKSTGATWVLSGSNSYSGGTSVTSGLLTITHQNALGTGTVSIGSGYGLINGDSERLTIANAFSLSGAAEFRGTMNISGAVSLSGGSKSNLTIGPNSEANVEISGVISGASEGSGFTKMGDGTLTLSGSNTFAGGVSISRGHVDVKHASALGTGKVFLANGSTLGNASGAALTIANDLDINPGTQTFNLQDKLTISGKITTNNTSTTVRTISVTGAELEFSGNVSAENRTSLTYAKSGTGTMTLSGSNSFTGFQLNEGRLNLNHAHALATGTFAIRLTGDKYLDNTSGSAITNASANPISIESGFTFIGSNDLDLGEGSVAISNYTITVEKNTLTMGGLVGATSRTITKAGAGTWAISGSSTLPNSAMTITGGALRLSHAGAMTGIDATGGVVRLIMDGGVIELTAASGDFNRGFGTGYHQMQIKAGGGGFSAYGTDAVVNIGGAGAVQKWGVGSWSDESKLMLSSKTATHTVDFQNGINLMDSAGTVVREIFVENGSAKVDARISGAISNAAGTAGLSKTGAGTLELTGTNTYNGLTTVSAGKLLVNGSISSALGVQVDASGTLGGSGALAKVSGAGTLSPGNSAGIITVGEIDASEGLDFHFELTAATVEGVSAPNFSIATGSGNDVIHLTGGTPFLANLTNENTITFDFTGTEVKPGDVFLAGFFASSDFADAIANANIISLGLDEAYTLNISTMSLNAAFAGGPQNGFMTQLEVIPEPSTALFVLAGGVVSLGALARRKRHTGA